MKSTMIAKVEKRIMAVMLSLMMVVGVFAGTKVDVKAAETRTIRFEDLKEGDIVHTGDIITISASQDGKNSLSLACDKPDSGQLCYDLGNKDNYTGDELSVTVLSVTHEGRTYTTFKMSHKVDDSHFAFFKFIDENTEAVTSTDKSKSGVTEVSNHTCSFQWVTTIDP